MDKSLCRTIAYTHCSYQLRCRLGPPTNYFTPSTLCGARCQRRPPQNRSSTIAVAALDASLGEIHPCSSPERITRCRYLSFGPFGLILGALERDLERPGIDYVRFPLRRVT